MPFAPPYRAFEPGDLVFGRADRLDELVEYFRATGRLPGDSRGPVRADDLADFLAPAGALDPVSAAFHAAARLHPKFRDAFDPAHPAEFRVRQRGKAALFWGAIGGGPPIHYSLAGVDDPDAMRQVADKSAEEDDPAGPFDPADHPPLTRFTKTRSAVGAELRWLYRHRQVTAVRSRVQFWRPDPAGFAPCPPPWDWPDESGAAWVRYAPKRLYTDADYPTG